MRRLLIALFCLAAFPAQAADLFVPVRTQALGFGSTVRYLTESFLPNTEGVQVTCTTSCYVAFGVSSALSVTAATGVLIPANIPVLMRHGGANIGVIMVSSVGIMSVTELSK